ncbi:carbohydrate ABC transporter permease [Nesterenkonia xinjiangensis]|uniref:Multiple sugar transport system permease protein n=1 Tax=Nesterenkonia xinjiangensis TaxID=225327 RepID=A0A7Z0K7U6_9MICC|nr:sugar ABC transporter permease [Nesterenkonia xinjiangensis]NYJ76971.1 multiple sugar transport system permease protein [Nesterenkonia xinjiangensis]
MSVTDHRPTTAPAPPDPSRSTGPAGGHLPAGSPGRRQKLRASGMLMAPFFLLMAGVFVAPLAMALYMSFFSQDNTGLGFGAPEQTFVGLRSYVAVFSDPTFMGSLGLILLFCVVYIPVVAVGALLLALLLDSGISRLRSVIQLGLFLPHAVPGIIAAIIWLYLYTPGISPVTEALSRLDLEINFLGVNMVVPSIINIAVWSSLGYFSVIFYAALQAVPGEVLEAARMDGAGPVRIATLVKLPMITSSLVMVLLFAMIWTLQLFTEPMLLSQSTPAINSRFSPSMYIYDAAFTRNNYGLAAAAAVVLMVATMALSFGLTKLSNRLQRQEGR